MIDDMRQHEQYMHKKLKTKLSKEEKARLATFHARRLAEFQHERFIHLLVTMFFACLLLGGMAMFVVLVSFSDNLSTHLVGLLVLILLILEIFYVRHYYLLENGVQQLYALTRQLEEKR